MNWIILSGIIGFLGSMLTWAYNEWQKRVEKLISEKEKRYDKLISLIRSFGSGSGDEIKANEFILELQLCWMYCPDEVIYKGNGFIQALTTESKQRPDLQKIADIAKGELALEIRRDLILTRKFFKFYYKNKKLTSLKPEDFKDVYYTKK